MIRILFICHGNICRSPMAEYVMKDLVSRAGLSGSFQIDSAATSGEEIGNGVHPGTRQKLREHGIPCGGHLARRLTAADYQNFDYLIGMDHANMRNMRRLCPDDGPEGKLRLLLSFAGMDWEVADPWYTGDFDATFADISAGCSALLSQLTEEHG